MNYSGSKLKCHWTNVNLILHKFLIIFSSQIHQRQRHSMLSKFIRVTLLTNSKPSDSDSEMKHKSFSVLVDIICFLFMLRTSRSHVTKLLTRHYALFFFMCIFWKKKLRREIHALINPVEKCVGMNLIPKICLLGILVLTLLAVQC